MPSVPLQAYVAPQGKSFSAAPLHTVTACLVLYLLYLDYICRPAGSVPLGHKPPSARPYVRALPTTNQLERLRSEGPSWGEGQTCQPLSTQKRNNLDEKEDF